MHPLDRPVWASLTTHHAHLSEGSELARRFVPDVNLFASVVAETSVALEALAQLVRPGETIFILQVPEIVVPPGFELVKLAKGVQMVATDSLSAEVQREDIRVLTDDDVAEMLALARLTEPGPFLTRTHVMGTFRGIHLDGRLAAMAGERMRFPGYTEVSGVCTHPDFRGRGLARCLSTVVAARIEARGERPFLHAWQSNHAAIALYETLGFELRTEVNVAVLRKPC
jgi:predicted GNAT family acetyltransferase